MIKKSLPAIICISFLLIVWQVIAQIINRPQIFPSVFYLLKTLGLFFTSATFYQSVSATVLRGLGGIFISVMTASGFAVLFARYYLLYELFRPLLTIMRSVPVVSFILLALIYFHAESIPLLISFLVMFPLLVENLTKGIQQLKPGYKAMADVFIINTTGRIKYIYYPQLKPFLFSGLASAMGFGWRAIIMGEVLSQCAFGIGSEMKRSQLYIDVPELLAWTIVAIIISFLFDKGIGCLEKKRVPFLWPSCQRKILTSPSTLIINDLSFSYREKVILSSVSFVFVSGKVYGISAPSGKGKTTLLNIINGILLPAGGTVIINREYGIASVFQEPELLPNLSVLENVFLPAAYYYTPDRGSVLAKQILTELEIEMYADNFPTELSYGQQQRVAIARALFFPSSFLLMDEPFKGLDEALSHRIIEYILRRQTNYKQTIIFTTHKQDELNMLADEIIYL